MWNRSSSFCAAGSRSWHLSDMGVTGLVPWGLFIPCVFGRETRILYVLKNLPCRNYIPWHLVEMKAPPLFCPILLLPPSPLPTPLPLQSADSSPLSQNGAPEKELCQSADKRTSRSAEIQPGISRSKCSLFQSADVFHTLDILWINDVTVVCVCVCILLHVNVTQSHVLDYITLMYLVSWFVDFGPSQNALFIKFQTFENRRLPCFCPVVRLRISFLSQNDNYACQSTPEQNLSRYLSVPLCCCSPYF